MAMVVFWLVFVVQWFLTKGKSGAAFLLAMLLVLFMGLFIRSVIIRTKFNGQAIDPETGKPRILEVKWLWYTLLGLMAIVIIGMLAGLVMGVVRDNNLAAYVGFLNYFPIIISGVAFILAILHMKKTITVSPKLLYTLVAIALVLCAAMVAVSMFTSIGVTYSSGNILSTVCTSCLALSFFRMRK
jgi:hypothetical protein